MVEMDDKVEVFIVLDDVIETSLPQRLEAEGVEIKGIYYNAGNRTHYAYKGVAAQNNLEIIGNIGGIRKVYTGNIPHTDIYQSAAHQRLPKAMKAWNDYVSQKK